jgi:predicted RNA binding protein YcfA (HicA-like mRNA interferase family)
VKRTDLLKRLASIGDVEVVREGGNHTIFRVNGNLVAIPRHREISERTAAAILRDAKKKG